MDEKLKEELHAVVVEAMDAGSRTTARHILKAFRDHGIAVAVALASNIADGTAKVGDGYEPPRASLSAPVRPGGHREVRMGQRLIGTVRQVPGGFQWAVSEGRQAMGDYCQTPEEAAQVVAKIWMTELE